MASAELWSYDLIHFSYSDTNFANHLKNEENMLPKLWIKEAPKETEV